MIEIRKDKRDPQGPYTIYINGRVFRSGLTKSELAYHKKAAEEFVKKS